MKHGKYGGEIKSNSQTSVLCTRVSRKYFSNPLLQSLFYFPFCPSPPSLWNNLVLIGQTLTRIKIGEN